MGFSDIYDEFKLRLKGPFYKTFILSWILVNWRIVFIAFGDFTTEDKISKISCELTCYRSSIWCPLIIAIVFFVGYRWIEVAAEMYLNLINRTKKKNKIESDKETFFTGVEYSKKIKDVEELNSVALRIRARASEFESKNVKLEEEVSKLKNNLGEKNILLKLGSSMGDSSILEGKWKFVYTNRNEDVETKNIYVSIAGNGDDVGIETIEGPKISDDSVTTTKFEFENIFSGQIFKQNGDHLLFAGDSRPSWCFFDLKIKRSNEETGRPEKLSGTLKGGFRDETGNFKVELVKISE